VTARPPHAVDVSVLVTTFRRPRHLALVLESIALQRLRDTALEVVVSDDGSGDDTPNVVRAFAMGSGIPVRYVSQPHEGFRLARARNAAARLARGDYLLFLDGDCMIPSHHVAAHVARRRRGTALLGYCARLSEAASQPLQPENLAITDLGRLVTATEHRTLARRHRKAWWHAAVRHPTKPRLAGGDFGVWRDEFLAVNGFDERFVGWGQEDDDLGLRLRGLGVRLASILDRTRSLHVWHETDPSATPRWRDGANVARFQRRGRLIRCRAGVAPRPTNSIRWGLADESGRGRLGGMLARHLAGAVLVPPGRACEIEVATTWGGGWSSRPAECRLLLTEAGRAVDPALLAAADQVSDVCDEPSLTRALDDAG
jgi:glycosyltransferase involved in cell wall biosynthesis